MTSSSPESGGNCRLLVGVAGRPLPVGQAKNDLLVTCPLGGPTSTVDGKVVVFFGGDAQNLAEAMEAHRDNRRYVRWSLENTCRILGRGFPDHDVVIVRPSRMERGTFSCYDNFVQSNGCGSPTHDYAGFGALDQLRHLLANVRPDLVRTDKVLVGFSKGVVVLNQILVEFHGLLGEGAAAPDDGLIEFARSVRRMVWLDGGHNGGKDIWITREDILKTLATKTDVQVDVRVTPYQIMDPMRPWIGKEEKRFRQLLGDRFGMSQDPQRFHRRLYFESEPPSLENHFRILEVLGSVDGASMTP